MPAWPVAERLPLADPAASTPRLAGLFDAHQPALYRLARRLTPTRDDALDLVQETFLKAAAHVDGVPAGERNEEAWLVRVLVNLQRDRWRRRSVRERHARARQAESPPRSEDAPAVTSVIVWQALDRLSPRRRAIVILRELDGRTTDDIAALLGIARVTVRWHLARARAQLAAWLQPLGDSPRRTR